MQVVSGQRVRCLDHLRTSPHIRCLSTSLRWHASLEYSGLPNYVHRVRTCYARDLLPTHNVATPSIPVLQRATLTTSSTLQSRLGPLEQKWLRLKKKPNFRHQEKDGIDDDELYKLPSDSLATHSASTTSAGPSEPVSLTSEDSSQQHSPFSFEPFNSSTNSSFGDRLFVEQVPLRPVQQANPEAGQQSESKQMPNHAIPRDQAPTSALEQELHHISNHDPHPEAIRRILAILISDRKIKPQSSHYEALILSNTWPESGSAENVRTIMLEMERESITMGAGVYTAMLKVLAIHPDATLTEQILRRMEQTWVDVTFEMKLYMLIGLVRTGQLELANEVMREMYGDAKMTRVPNDDGVHISSSSSSSSLRPDNDMNKKGKIEEVVPGYVHILFIRTLLEISSGSTISHSYSFATTSLSRPPLPPEHSSTRDWSGVYSYLTRLYDRHSGLIELTSIPTEFWVWLLTESTRDQERWVSEWTWWTFLSPRKTKISGLRDGVAMDLLEVASLYGRIRLAEDVIGYLRFARDHPNDSDPTTPADKQDAQNYMRERQENRLLTLARSNSLRWGNMRSWPGDDGVSMSTTTNEIDGVRRVQISSSTSSTSTLTTSSDSESSKSAESSEPSSTSEPYSTFEPYLPSKSSSPRSTTAPSPPSSHSSFMPFSLNIHEDGQDFNINSEINEDGDNENKDDSRTDEDWTMSKDENEIKIEQDRNRNQNQHETETEKKQEKEIEILSQNQNQDNQDKIKPPPPPTPSPPTKKQGPRSGQSGNEWNLYRDIPGLGSPAFDAWAEIRAKK